MAPALSFSFGKGSRVGLVLLVIAMLAACASTNRAVQPAPAPEPPPAAPAAQQQAAVRPAAPAARASAPAPMRPPPARPNPPIAPTPAAIAAVVEQSFVAPAAAPFDRSIARAGAQLLADAHARLGNEPRSLVVDPLIDANTGAQTVSTVRMGRQLESIIKAQHAGWTVRPFTRQSLREQPLLLIGTLTPVNVERAIDTPPDAYRVWLTLIDLRSGKVVAKQLDRATVDSVNPEPLKFYADSPTWHKDKTVSGYINSCQINTKIGDAVDPDYLARLPAAAAVNEAILAYGEQKVQAAHQAYKAAESLAEPGDLRVLNGLYLTSWNLGQHEAAKAAFGKIVASGLEAKRLPIKLLFQTGGTVFLQAGDLPQQYSMWVQTLAQHLGQVQACVRVVGHTSRTGSARASEALSRQRAVLVQHTLERANRALSTRLSAAGAGSREALVGLGTDDMRDALDRRVEFRVVDCV
jgi:outer membrane protein OmpA-like peptidoglycan-associated protein